VDGCCVLVVFLSSTDGDKDDEEKEEEQTVDGDTHSNQTCLVCREFVVVRRGTRITDLDAVGVGIDGSSTGGCLDNDVIVNLLDEMEAWGSPFQDFKAVGAGEDVRSGSGELECVRNSEVSRS